MANHEVGEEEVDGLHDRGWDDLGLRIVPVEVKGGEDSDQDGVKEGSIVGKGGLAQPFEHCRADLESYSLTADIFVKQVHDNRLDAGELLGRLLGVLANEGHKEGTQGWDQVLHLFCPVCVDRVVVEDRGTEHLVVLLELRRECNECCIQLECVADIVTHALRNYSV